MIAIYSADRAWRSACERALRLAGVRARVASRPAELAKCLADGMVTVVLIGSESAAAAEAATVTSTQRHIYASPGDTIDELVHRATMMLSD